MDRQREVICTLRRGLMHLPSVEGVLFDFVDELPGSICAPLEGMKEAPDADMCAQVDSRLLQIFNIARKMPEMTMSAIPGRERSRKAVEEIFEELREDAGPACNGILRYFLLDPLDRCWKEHLRSMDCLHEGIACAAASSATPGANTRPKAWPCSRT